MKRFAHITDLHVDEEFIASIGVDARKNWGIILDDLKGKGIDNVVFTGDIGLKESNEWFFGTFAERGLQMQAALGNHDTFPEAIRHYNPGIPEGQDEFYYADEDDHFRYLFLDSSSGHISYEQFAWFREQIRSESDKPLILFLHHPILDTGTTPQQEYPLHEGEELRRELKKLPNDVHIFCGHLHFEDDMRDGNIRQIITPASCYQCKRHSAATEKDHVGFGYRIVELGEGDVRSEIVMFDPAS